MAMIRRPLFTVFVSSFSLLAPSLLWAAATLQPLKGTVSIQHAQSTGWEEISQDMKVEQGDQIRTGDQSRAFLITTEDHRVAIGPNTHLTLSHLEDGKTKLYVASGVIRQKVRKLNIDQGQYYKVQTPTAVCAVRGTDFSTLVNSLDKITTLKTFEGAVSFGKDEVHAILVQMGEGASAHAGNALPIQKEMLPPQEQPTPTQGQEDKKADDKQSPDGSGPKGPPPPGGGPSSGPGNWWDHPNQSSDNLFNGEPDKTGDTNQGPHGQQPGPHNPWKEGRGFGPDFDPHHPGHNNPLGGYGNNYNGQGGGGGGGTAQGFDALIDTLRANQFHDQANTILVADLFQRRAVGTDPLTGQYRQYADAIASAGSSGLRFLSASMVAGQPQTLSMDMVRMTFNQPLPSLYTDATKTAFYSTSMPTYWVKSYVRDMTNTVDHVLLNLDNGHPVAGTGGYVTRFDDGAAKVAYPGGETTLWTLSGGNISYLGGAAPDHTVVQVGNANTEVQNVYHNTGAGDLFFSVRNTFSEPGGRIASPGSVPNGMSASEYLSGLNVRTTIFCNRFAKGRIDLFGSAQARLFAGLFAFQGDSEASNILHGNSIREAPNGLDPF